MIGKVSGGGGCRAVITINLQDGGKNSSPTLTTMTPVCLGGRVGCLVADGTQYMLIHYREFIVRMNNIISRTGIRF